MKREINYAIINLGKAISKLHKGVLSAKDELDKDGVIQRFEFTFELFWKTLRVFLRDSGIETKTPKESLKEAFRVGWLDDEDIFLDMLEDRNKTSHIYDKETSEVIFERIKDSYIICIQQVLDKLKKQAGA